MPSIIETTAMIAMIDTMTHRSVRNDLSLFAQRAARAIIMASIDLCMEDRGCDVLAAAVSGYSTSSFLSSIFTRALSFMVRSISKGPVTTTISSSIPDKTSKRLSPVSPVVT